MSRIERSNEKYQRSRVQIDREADWATGRELERKDAEIDRLRAGLEIIREAGPIHGGAWCAAQARGYLEDLDFDAYPETGKAPR